MELFTVKLGLTIRRLLPAALHSAISVKDMLNIDGGMGEVKGGSSEEVQRKFAVLMKLFSFSFLLPLAYPPPPISL